MGVVDELLGMISEPMKKLMNDICREYDAHALEQSRIIGEYQNVCITLKEQWVKAGVERDALRAELNGVKETRDVLRLQILQDGKLAEALNESCRRYDAENALLRKALDYALLTAPEKGPGWSTRISQMSHGERLDDACIQEEAQSTMNKVLADFFRLAVLAYDRGVYEHEIRAICDGREP